MWNEIGFVCEVIFAQLLSMFLWVTLLSSSPFAASSLGKRIVHTRLFFGMNNCAVYYERDETQHRTIRAIQWTPAFQNLCVWLQDQHVSISLHVFTSEFDKIKHLLDSLRKKITHFQVAYDPQFDLPCYAKCEATLNGYRAVSLDEDGFCEYAFHHPDEFLLVSEDESRWIRDGKQKDSFFGKRAMCRNSFFCFERTAVLDTETCWHVPWDNVPFVRVDAHGMIHDPNYFIRRLGNQGTNLFQSRAFWFYTSVTTLFIFLLALCLEWVVATSLSLAWMLVGYVSSGNGIWSTPIQIEF